MRNRPPLLCLPLALALMSACTTAPQPAPPEIGAGGEQTIPTATPEPQEATATSAPEETAAAPTQPPLGAAAPPDTPTPAEEEEPQVEVFSWWIDGRDAEALDALVGVFQQDFPEIELINAAAESGDADARAVLATRLAQGEPPDSWQAHAGQEVYGAYVLAGQVEPVTFLYQEQGWVEALPPHLIDLIEVDGEIYSVPVSVNRTNVLWMNPAILEQAGLETPATWEDLLAACDVIERRRVACLALGNPETALHLFETVLLSYTGPDLYNALWRGEADWDALEVSLAIETFGALLDHTNPDARSLGWQEAAQLLAEDRAAFLVMGDWVEGYYADAGLVPGEDYDWMPVPGTQGVFQFAADSFVLAVGAPHPESAINWLRAAGSLEGQQAFNPPAGSICPRTDCDPTLFGAYQQSAIRDWQNDALVGSLTYGVAADPAWRGAIGLALVRFMGDRDEVAFQTVLIEACALAGVCVDAAQSAP